MGHHNNAEKDRGEVLYTLWLSCPRVLGELFMKVLTEEEQVQQGAFLWGATTAGSQVGLSLSCGLWILMMVQWSRYANLQCSFSPVSAEKSGCVQICNLCCDSAPPIFPLPFCTPAPSLPLLVLPLRISVLLHFHILYTHLLQYVYFWIALTPSYLSLFISCTLLTLSLLIDSSLNIT